jgi:hypothetical protein
MTRSPATRAGEHNPELVDDAAYHGRLASDGVALRLLPGWSGRIEVPANQAAAQLVLRARHGDVQVVLLQMVGAQGRHADLPITRTPRTSFKSMGSRIAAPPPRLKA